MSVDSVLQKRSVQFQNRNSLKDNKFYNHSTNISKSIAGNDDSNKNLKKLQEEAISSGNSKSSQEISVDNKSEIESENEQSVINFEKTQEFNADNNFISS